MLGYLMIVSFVFVFVAGLLVLGAMAAAAWRYYAVRYEFWRKMRGGVRALPRWNGGYPPVGKPVAFLLSDDPQVYFGIRIGDHVEARQLSAFAHAVVGWIELPSFPSQWYGLEHWRKKLVGAL